MQHGSKPGFRRETWDLYYLRNNQNVINPATVNTVNTQRRYPVYYVSYFRKMIPGEREYFSNISFHFLRIHVDKIDPVYRLDWIDGLHATITFFDNVKRCRVSGFCSSPSTLHAFSLFYRRFTARSVATNFSSSHFQIGETPTALASLPSVDNTIGHINTNFPRNAKDS